MWRNYKGRSAEEGNHRTLSLQQNDVMTNYGILLYSTVAAYYFSFWSKAVKGCWPPQAREG